MKIEVCSPVKDVVVRDNSTNVTGNINADAELIVLADANTQSRRNPRISVGERSDGDDAFTADSMMAVAVRSDSSCRVVSGNGSAEYRNMSLTGERQVQSVRNSPKFLVRPIVRDELGNSGFKSAILDTWNQEDDLHGASSHMVWDFYNSTSSSISPHDQTIIGYPGGLLKVRRDSATNSVRAYVYDFPTQTWASGVTIARNVRNQTSLTDDTTATGTPLDYNISPSGFYDETTGKVFVSITQFNYAALSLEHSIYSATPGSSDWRKVSTQVSSVGLNLQKQVDSISFYLQAELSSLRFKSNSPGLLSYFEVEIVDTGGVTGDDVSISVLGYVITIDIDLGATTIGTIYDAFSNTPSLTESLTIRMLAGRDVLAELGSEIASPVDSLVSYDYGEWSTEYDTIIPAENLITAFNSFKNRTRLVRGRDRWALITSVIVEYDMDVMIYTTSGGGAYEVESTTREFYSLTSVMSFDNGSTWQDIGSPKIIETPSPLQQAAQDLIEISSAARKYGANLFDLFDIGAQNSGLSDVYSYSGYTYDRTGRNPWFSAYYDETMEEFVIAKRADGVNVLRDKLIMISTEGNYGRWRPLCEVQFRGDNIDNNYGGDTYSSYQISDITCVGFEQDLNYMVLDGWYEYQGLGSNDGPYETAQVVAIPFKFFSNRRNSYNAEIDSLGVAREDHFVVSCGRDYTLVYGKFAAQQSAIVPNMAIVQGADVERCATQYPIACAFQDQLVVEFEGLPSNGRMFGITQQWQPWFEICPYQNVEIPCVADDPISSTFTPDLTYWDDNKSDPSATSPFVAGRTFRFTIDDGYGTCYSSKNYVMGSSNAISDTFKCRFACKIVSSSGGVSAYNVPLVSCRINKGSVEQYWPALRLIQDFGDPPRIALWDQESNDEVASWTSDDFDPTADEWQFFFYAHAGGVEFGGIDGAESEQRVVVYGRKVASGVEGRWRELISRRPANFTARAYESTGYVEWGSAADAGGVGPELSGVSSPQMTLAYRYFSHSWYAKAEYAVNAAALVEIGNPFVFTGRPSNNTTQYRHIHEGLSSSDFSERYGAVPFGRKCRSVPVSTPFGYDVSFEGTVKFPANFLIGRYGESFDVSDLVSGARSKQYVTPPLVASDQFILDLSFANIRETKYDYIAFINCEIYDFDIKLASALEDEALLSTITDPDYNYEEFEAATSGYDFVTLDTTEDLLSRFDSSRSFIILMNEGVAVAIMNVAEIGSKFVVVDVEDPRYQPISDLTFDSVRVYRKDFVIPLSDFYTPASYLDSPPNLVTVYAPSGAATNSFDALESERKLGKVLFLRRDDVTDLVESFEETRFDTVIQETLRRRYPEIAQKDRRGFTLSMFAASNRQRRNSSRIINRFLSGLAVDSTVVVLKRSSVFTAGQAASRELTKLAPNTTQVVAIELTNAIPSMSMDSNSSGQNATLSLTLYES